MFSIRKAFPALNALPLKGLAIVASLSLAGCVGGGSDGGSGDTKASAVCGETEIRNLLVGENSHRSENLSLCFDAESASLEGSEHIQDLHWEGNRLTFRTGDVDRPNQARIRVLDPNGATQVDINVVIENTSGQDIETRAEHLVDQSESIKVLESDRQVYAYTLEVAYLDDQISWSERQAMLAQWTPESTQSHDTLSEKIKETRAVLEDYRRGKVGEQQLAEAADNAISYLPSHGDYGARKLDELASDDRIDVRVPDVSFGVFTWRSSVEQVSRRLGNSAYGDLESGEWNFDSRYRFLTAVNDLETRS